MTVTMPSCTSTDACISQIAVNYAFPVTVRLNSTNGFLNGSLVLFDLGDTFKYTYEIPVNPAENFTEIEIELNHTYTYLGFFNVNFTFLSSSENVFSTIVMIAQTFTSILFNLIQDQDIMELNLRQYVWNFSQRMLYRRSGE